MVVHQRSVSIAMSEQLVEIYMKGGARHTLRSDETQKRMRIKGDGRGRDNGGGSLRIE